VNCGTNGAGMGIEGVDIGAEEGVGVGVGV